MDHATIPDPLKVNISQFSKPTELRDQAGEVLGVFIPAICWSRGDWTLEELEAALIEPGGKSIDEILQSLGSK
jgi:hypothetical protein